jgi:ribosomal protein S27E
MFLTHCPNCKDEHEPVLVVDDKKEVSDCDAVCPECDTVMKEITPFAKVQMKTMGQVKRAKKRQQAFMVRCPHCKNEGCPVVGEKDVLLCSSCSKPLDHLAAPYKQTVLMFLKTHSPEG